MVANLSPSPHRVLNSNCPFSNYEAQQLMVIQIHLPITQGKTRNTSAVCLTGYELYFLYEVDIYTTQRLIFSLP